MDNDCYVYVTYQDNSCIQKFTPEGNFLNEWETTGGPCDIAIDTNNYIYIVVNSWNNVIQKFTSEGTLIREWIFEGSEYNHYGIVVDNDYVYLTDKNNCCIKMFTLDGLLITSFGNHGTEPGLLWDPFDLCVNKNGNIFIADSRNNRIQIFNFIPEIFLSVGLNIFGKPGNIPKGYTSYDLLSYLGTENEILKIQRHNVNYQTYENTFYNNGVTSGDKFDIENGEGCFVYMKVNKSFSFNDSINNPTFSLYPLKKGKNIIFLQCFPPDFTSYDFISYLGAPNEIQSIQKYNNNTGLFETTAYHFGRPAGTNFMIEYGEAYLIHAKVNKNIYLYK